jgi:excisionase family DNA binding protein
MTTKTASFKPTNEDIELARASRAKVAKAMKRGNLVRRDTLSVPQFLGPAILAMLDAMAHGNVVTVISSEAELTSQQAADMIGVSRPFLIQLLESGEIPFRKVGTHRRIRYVDLMEYKQQVDAQREAVLLELQKEAQDLNMGY